MALRFSKEDASGFKLFFCLSLMYGLMSVLLISIINMKFMKPLEIDAPLDHFSEARAIEHIRVLSEEIDGRQEGRPGLRKAAEYIKGQLEMIKDRAGSNIRVEIDETTINGSFNMMFLGHSISLGYRNISNIAMRISSSDAQDDDPSVMINGHFDSPLGSPGAADCGSCVASMLEIARLATDSGYIPTRPIIFLFNGGEELYMLAAHGFMKTHKWRDTIGAFINLEASGTGGLDLICQSGPGSWPASVYAQSAIHPMAHSAAQDVFPAFPGDTDFRIFSQDYGNIPGLDMIFLLGGYFYHTSYDTIENLLPGSIQARGDNLFSIIKAFANSSQLQTSCKGASCEAATNPYKDERDVFFDYLSWFMIFYSRNVALVLHSIPIAILPIAPFVSRLRYSGSFSWFATFFDFIKGFLFHALGIVLGVTFPVIFSILRLLFSSYTMHWFSHPYLAALMFIPCSLVGLLIPRFVWSHFPHSQDVSAFKNSKEKVDDEARFWGAFGFYSILTMAYLKAGLSGGFLTFYISASMLIAWISFSMASKYYKSQSLRSTVFYVIPLVPCLAYSVYFGAFLAQFLIEKMGMMGAIPPPFGYFIPDVIVAAIIGLVTGWCFGPLIPICGRWLARKSILQFLLHLIVIAIALSTQFFPYKTTAPKRVVFQHTIHTAGHDNILDSSYEFSVVDSNSLLFVFKHAPDVARELQISSELSFETANMSRYESWLSLFPVQFLFSRSLKFPTRSKDLLEGYTSFPHLFSPKPQEVLSGGSRRVYLELSLGSTKEVWVTALNITGPLSSWSFADNMLPVPETAYGGPPSYICRLSGISSENWSFWLEANSSEELRIDVAVLDQHISDDQKRLKSLFPDWMDVTAYSSFLSSYSF